MEDCDPPPSVEVSLALIDDDIDAAELLFVVVPPSPPMLLAEP